MEYKGLTESTKRDEVPSSRGLGTEVCSFSFSALKIVTSLDKSRSGDRDPQTVRGTGAPAKPSNSRDQARAARGEAKLSPRPVAEDAAARAMTALKEKGTMVPRSVGSPEVDSPETQSSGGASSWQRGERVSYLAGLAGVVEGVDVLGGEAHHPAVDAIELCAPGGVVGVAAQRCGWCRAPGCHR